MAGHQYSCRSDALAGRSIMLILSGFLFRGRCHGHRPGLVGWRVALVAILCAEVALYVLHNVTGAFTVDLPLKPPVLLIASLLGYASAATATRHRTLTAGIRHPARPVWSRSAANRAAR